MVGGWSFLLHHSFQRNAVCPLQTFELFKTIKVFEMCEMLLSDLHAELITVGCLNDGWRWTKNYKTQRPHGP